MFDVSVAIDGVSKFNDARCGFELLANEGRFLLTKLTCRSNMVEDVSVADPLLVLLRDLVIEEGERRTEDESSAGT